MPELGPDPFAEPDEPQYPNMKNFDFYYPPDDGWDKLKELSVSEILSPGLDPDWLVCEESNAQYVQPLEYHRRKAYLLTMADLAPSACNDRRWFTSYIPFRSQVSNGNNDTPRQVEGIGLVRVPVYGPESGTFTFVLEDTLHIPTAPCSIVSWKRWSSTFNADHEYSISAHDEFPGGGVYLKRRPSQMSQDDPYMPARPSTKDVAFLDRQGVSQLSEGAQRQESSPLQAPQPEQTQKSHGFEVQPRQHYLEHQSQSPLAAFPSLFGYQEPGSDQLPGQQLQPPQAQPDMD